MRTCACYFYFKILESVNRKGIMRLPVMIRFFSASRFTGILNMTVSFHVKRFFSDHAYRRAIFEYRLRHFAAQGHPWDQLRYLHH